MNDINEVVSIEIIQITQVYKEKDRILVKLMSHSRTNLEHNILEWVNLTSEEWDKDKKRWEWLIALRILRAELILFINSIKVTKSKLQSIQYTISCLKICFFNFLKLQIYTLLLLVSCKWYLQLPPQKANLHRVCH